MSRQMFVNLPVKDLPTTIEFFTKLGFSFDPKFTDENATCMIVGEGSFVMLLTEARFRDFTKKSITDATKQIELLLAISADSRDAVDEMVNTALASGGTAANDKQDHGFMYGWSFDDPNGHTWEVLWMDPAAA